jgi:4-hydroxythreonine-4-phosphate dehydrogenase
MRAATAIIADDLTGAADAGVGLRRAGLAVRVVWGSPEFDAQALDRADVLSIDAATRPLDLDAAVAATTRMVSHLRAAGVPTLYKKIDSTLRGHVGAELRATLAGWQPRPIAIVAPAFPEMKRTTVDGRQRVDGTPLGQPALPAVLEKAGVRSGLVDLARVRKGPLSDSFSEFREQGVGAIVCDAETTEDLRAIAHGGARLGAGVVWVGSGGLAQVLGPALGLSAGVGVTDGQDPVLDGPKLIVVGSAAPMARAQAVHLAGSRIERLEIPAAALLGTATPAGILFEHAIPERLRRGLDLLITIADELPPGDAADSALLDRLTDWLRPCAPLVGALVVTGGETASRILRGWGVTGLDLIEEMEPGVPLSISVGPRALPIVTKAGAFGDPQTLTRSVTKLRNWLKAQTRQRELGGRV